MPEKESACSDGYGESAPDVPRITKTGALLLKTDCAPDYSMIHYNLYAKFENGQFVLISDTEHYEFEEQDETRPFTDDELFHINCKYYSQCDTNLYENLTPGIENNYNIP